ncbi:MAG: ATP-binding cassette domain-containing protein [Pseudomonadota bacterium]|nr:ATP-binding cassette domain-containing protein [Pseudomonadota bacterium]
MSPADIIRCEHVVTQIGDHLVHKEDNLAIHSGEIFSLLGGSGSGKTVLLREMIGLMESTKGRVALFGIDWKEANEEERSQIRSRFGVMFQHGALISTLTVFDNIALPLRELRVFDESMIEQLVLQKLQMTGLDASVAGWQPAVLSGGMVKRVALARALALEPELIFLDEPTAGLDPVSSMMFRVLIQRLHQQLGLTVVMITHDQVTLEHLSHRVGILADGRIIAQGSIEEAKQVDHPFIRSYFSPERLLSEEGES